MTTCAFWSTAGLLMTGGAEGVAAAAAAELDATGVTEAAAVLVWSVVFLATAVAGFLQLARPSAKNRGRIANRISINAVKRFKLRRGNYKRFLASSSRERKKSLAALALWAMGLA